MRLIVLLPLAFLLAACGEPASETKDAAATPRGRSDLPAYVGVWTPVPGITCDEPQTSSEAPLIYSVDHFVRFDVRCDFTTVDRIGDEDRWRIAAACTTGSEPTGDRTFELSVDGDRMEIDSRGVWLRCS